MKQINFKTSKIVQRVQKDRYKIVLSILFGFFGLLGAIFSVHYNVGNIKINIDWYLIFPLLIALSWGRIYGCISIVFGMSIWYPLFINGYHGWECFVPSICLFIWVLLHGYGAEKRLQSRSVFTNLYFLQLIYNIISLILYFNVLPFLLLFNPLFSDSGIITALSYGDIAMLALKRIIFESLLLVITDILLQLPFIRRILRLGYSQISRYNTRIVVSVVIFGMLLFIITIIGYSYIIMKQNNLHWLLSRTSNIITGFFLTSIVFFIIGGLSARIFQCKHEIVFCNNITTRKQAEEEILMFNNELEERVLERTSELKAAIDELEIFTYTVSHDLKSPLRAINTYSRIMLEDYPQSMEGEKGEIINSIMNISQNMIAMVNKLLLYSTTDKQEINKEYINCNDMIHKIFYEITSAISNRKIKLIMEKELPQVKADSILLKQVFYNIISNAVKFTKNRDPAIITVKHTMNKEEIIFSIHDNGVGFDMKLSGKLFGVFERLHPVEEFEGTGIGLATVRKIINKHEGRTWIEAIPDKGATVYIALPISESIK